MSDTKNPYKIGSTGQFDAQRTNRRIQEKVGFLSDFVGFLSDFFGSEKPRLSEGLSGLKERDRLKLLGILFLKLLGHMDVDFPRDLGITMP